MKGEWSGGKGSTRRKGSDQEKYASNWDRIFGNKNSYKERENALDELTQLSQEMGAYNDIHNPLKKEI